MEGVFVIIKSYLKTVDMLKTPGMVNKARVNLWYKDLLDKGVYGPDSSGTMA